MTTPLKYKPPTGKTFVWMKCDVVECAVQGEGLKAATQAIGWQYKELNYKGADPATLVSALNQALRYHPAAVGLSGLPEAVWQSVLPAYKAAHVAIVTAYDGPMEYDNTVIGQVGSPADYLRQGAMIGNYIVADSNGSAHVLLQAVSDYPALRSFADGFQQTIQKNCPNCKVTVDNNTIPQLTSGGVVPSITAALQRDRSIKYVASVSSEFVDALPSVLAAAGRNDVKIISENGNANTLTDIKAGKSFVATTGFAVLYAGWLMIDMVLRNMEGVPFDPDGDGGLPSQLLTKKVPFEISNNYEKPSDYADQFKTLWLLR